MALPFVTLVGEKYRKPKLVGYGMLLMGVGTVLFSLPHFIAASLPASVDVAGALCTATTAAGPLHCTQPGNLSQFR